MSCSLKGYIFFNSTFGQNCILILRMAANVKNPRWYHYLAIFPLFAIIRIWQASLRLVPQKGSKRYMISPDRMVGIAWHDSIFFLPMAKRAFRKKFPMAGLVSASRDGSYLCAFFKFCGIGTVRGSSRKRAATSAIGLIDTIRKGSDVFITPDGPLGPAHKAKNGFLTVAKETQSRILLLHIRPRHFRRLKTWDGFMLPLPFSRVDISAFEFKNADSLEETARAANTSPEVYVGRFLSNGSFEA